MELQPCPFCGSKAEFSDDYLFFSVHCTNADCEIQTKRFEFELSAINAWNKRHSEPLKQCLAECHQLLETVAMSSYVDYDIRKEAEALLAKHQAN